MIPAAFVSTVPSRLINHFDPVWAIALVSMTALLAGLAHLAFTRGLGRYTSGAGWTGAQ